MIKIRSELAGMGPTPRDPQAVLEGQSTLTLVPTSMLSPTSSQHLMTCPEPMLSGRGEFLVQLESKTVPSFSVPSQCICTLSPFFGRVPAVPSASTSIEYFSVSSSLKSDRQATNSSDRIKTFIIQYLQINIHRPGCKGHLARGENGGFGFVVSRLAWRNKTLRMRAFKSNNHQGAMGQKNSKAETVLEPTPESLEQAQKYLFETDPQLFTLDSLAGPIKAITIQFHRERFFEQTEEGFRVSSLLLRMTHQPEFVRCVRRMLEVLAGELRGLVATRVLALVPRERFSRCVTLANLVIFLADQSMLQNINLLTVRTDLEPATREEVNRWAKEGAEVPQFLFEDVAGEELLQTGKMLRLGIGLMIDLHLKLLTRSDFTLTIVDRLNQACFVLYCKLFFSGRHDFAKRERTENAKALVRIAAYFVGLGVEWKVASVYELGVLLAEAVASGSEGVIEGKALPSHLFKSLPIVNNNEMANWLAVALLFQLKHVTHDKKVFNRLNANRIPSLRLLEKILKNTKTPTQQLTFMLEELCLQTKPNQIERVYVCSLAATYSALEKVDSQILKRFTEGRDLTYNVKIMNRQKRVKPEDVRTELEDGEQDVQKECVGLCSKYITHVVLRKNDVLYEYSDKALWNAILCHLDQEANAEDPPRGELKEPDEQ